MSVVLSPAASPMLAPAPVLVALLTAALTAASASAPRWQRGVSLVGVLGFWAAATAALWPVAQGQVLSTAFGAWPLPQAIEFRLDALSAPLVWVTALMGVATLLYLHSAADTSPRHPALLPLIHGTLAGVAGAFSTADLFNLYVWFEIMLICALGLLAVGAQRLQLDATFKYLSLNWLGTLLLLAAVGLLYATTGHLNYSALQAALPQVPGVLATALVALLLAGLWLKSGGFPLYAWLPASYPALPTAVLALVAGLLTKVGVYAVLRTAGGLFAPAALPLQDLLGWLACATMLLGVLGAAYHWDMRRILAFHILSQIGYILLAVALGGPGGHAAALFYTVHHIVVKANLFLVAGMAAAYAGSHDLRHIGGLLRQRPALAVLFAVPALSLVGIPPLSGFWAKVLVLQEAFAQGRHAWAAVGLLVSVLTLYSMLKIWNEAFAKAPPEADAAAAPGVPPLAGGAAPAAVGGAGAAAASPAPSMAGAWVATVGLASVTMAIGLGAQGLLALSQLAARALGGAP